jgi:hypothetical protein
MRPKSIVTFERLVLIGLAIGILNSFLVAGRMEAMVATQARGMTMNTVYAVQAITIVLYLVLVWFISRKGSPIAKWIYIVLSALGLLFGLVGLGQAMQFGTLPLIINLIQYAIAIATIYLLFRPDAKAWFNDGRSDAV